MIKVRGIDLDINVLEELEAFDFVNGKSEGNEYKACSPFRNERKPSFYVNLETGLFIDHGAEDADFKRGNLIKLLAFLHNYSYEEAEEYLLEKYSTITTDIDGLDLNINIQFEAEQKKVFTKEELKPYLYRNKAYLLNRGITEDIQKKFIVGYDKEKHNIAFFWLDALTGKVVNVKFRSTKGKQFFYIKGGQKVSQHVFGLYQVIKEGCRKVYITESEIDAMYLWSNSIPAIALGGSHLSKEQKRKLLLAGVEHYVIATDNDNAGKKIADQIKAELAGMVQLSEITLPNYAKDVNDVKTEDIKKLTDRELPVSITMNLYLNV